MKPLNYSQYRIQQALWLQSSDSVRTNNSVGSEQYYLQCYIRYLRICGFELPVLSSVAAALGWQNNERALFKDKEKNKRFKTWIANNTISIVDRLVKKHLGI